MITNTAKCQHTFLQWNFEDDSLLFSRFFRYRRMSSSLSSSSREARLRSLKAVGVLLGVLGRMRLNTSSFSLTPRVCESSTLSPSPSIHCSLPLISLLWMNVCLVMSTHLVTMQGPTTIVPQDSDGSNNIQSMYPYKSPIRVHIRIWECLLE